MSDSEQTNLIRASGLFDPEFYRKTYGAWLADGEDPLRHFLSAGLAQGYLPSAGFDPVLYRVLTPGCGSENPLLHSLASGVPFRPRPLPELFPEISVLLTPNRIVNADLLAEHKRIYTKDAAVARDIAFTVEGKRFAVKIPEPGVLVDRLRTDRPFAFARLPHGFWDSLWMIDFAESNVAADGQGRKLSPPQRKALARRICASIRTNNGNFAPSFTNEVLADIPVHAAHPDFLRAVSFTGYPTFDGDVIGTHPFVPRDAVLGSFAGHFRPEETVYDAMLGKRLMVTGPLGALPELCRGRPVVLVASDFFATLGARWNLEDFTHVEIPRSLSQWQRWDLLARSSGAVAAACARGGRPPVVLTQCGGSLAYWLITRLFARYPGVFYLDLGQALNGWFFDIPELNKAAWVRLYAGSVITNCHLESYYRSLLGAAYDGWFSALTNPVTKDKSMRNAGALRNGNAVTGAGGTTQSDVKGDETLDAIDVVSAIKARRPGLFGADVTDQAAGAVLLHAFQVVREQVGQAREGVITIKGLGAFHIRNEERGDGNDRVTRKAIRFRLK